MSKQIENLTSAWSQLRTNPDVSVASVCANLGLGDGDEVLLLTARFEQRILRVALLLEMEIEVGGKTRSDGPDLMLEFRHQYNSFEKEEKFGLMPLFFDLEMKKPKSGYMKKELIAAYYPCLKSCLEEDDISEEDLKAEFLASGYNKLMPFIHLVDDDYKAKR